MHSYHSGVVDVACRHGNRSGSSIVRGMHRPYDAYGGPWYNVRNRKEAMKSDRPKGNRRSIRLPGYDYAQPGAYFVTICTHGGECLFDDPLLRRVAETVWQELPRHFPRLSLDAWVVMPNHFHGIPILSDARVVGAMHSSAGSPRRQASPPVEGVSWSEGSDGNASPLRLPCGAARGSLGAIIGNFKSVVARRINQIRDTPGAPVWQRNYYEHVIRTEDALRAIREYIVRNPARWQMDRYNLQATEHDPMAAELWRLLEREAC
jgi:REP-associated tyrosine transposase